jgi:hypothetical protein
MKDEHTPPKSTDQADMEEKGDNIIRVTNTRGATIRSPSPRSTDAPEG